MNTKLEKLDVVVRLLRDEAELLIGHRTIVEEGNENLDLRNAIAPRQEAYAFDLVIYALARTVASACTRLMDRPQPDRASLPHVFEKLLTAETIRNLRNRAGSWFPGIPQRTRVDEQTAIDALERAGAGYRSISDEAKERLRAFRNTHEAHLLIYERDEPTLQVNEVLAIADKIAGIIEDLCLGVQGHEMVLKDSKVIWKVRAKLLWSRMMNGMPDEGIEDALDDVP